MFDDQGLDQMRSLLGRLIRVGGVTAAYPDRATVRVRFEDADNVVSHELRVLTRKTLRDKDYWMPDVGEQVLCLCLPHGREQGFVLGTFYSQPDKPPVTDQDKRHVLFADGTWLEYDRKTHRLTGHVKGWAELTVDENLTATVGKSITATVGQNVDVQAGGWIKAKADGNADVEAGGTLSLKAPLIDIQGVISSSGPGGAVGTVTEKSDRTHEGSYDLTGPATFAGNVQINGDLTVTGTIHGAVENP